MIAGLAVRGVWTPQTEVLFDIHVADTDARSYLNQTPLNVLTNAEKKKENTQLQQKRDGLGSVHTTVCISGWLAGDEAATFLK